MPKTGPQIDPGVARLEDIDVVVAGLRARNSKISRRFEVCRRARDRKVCMIVGRVVPRLAKRISRIAARPAMFDCPANRKTLVSAAAEAARIAENITAPRQINVILMG